MQAEAESGGVVLAPGGIGAHGGCVKKFILFSDGAIFVKTTPEPKAPVKKEQQPKPE